MLGSSFCLTAINSEIYFISVLVITVFLHIWFTNFYIGCPYKQSEGSAVWIPAPGRDIPALQPSSFYSLPPPGQPLSFAPSQAGHGAFTGIYHPTQTVAATAVHPLLPQSQPMSGAVEMVGPPAGVYQQQQRAQINWTNNYWESTSFVSSSHKSKHTQTIGMEFPVFQLDSVRRHQICIHKRWPGRRLYIYIYLKDGWNVGKGSRFLKGKLSELHLWLILTILKLVKMFSLV